MVEHVSQKLKSNTTEPDTSPSKSNSNNNNTKHVLTSQTPFVRSGGATLGTNQIAELTAVLVALRTYSVNSKKRAKHLVIQSDSSYSINCATVWIKNWKKNGWKNSKKQIISNIELIKAIDFEICERIKQGGTIDFVKVKGHSGEFYNEMADEEANKKSSEWDLKIMDSVSCDYSEMPKEAVNAIEQRKTVKNKPEILNNQGELVLC